MASMMQQEAARRNIERAQEKWRSMPHRQRALAQPQGRARKKPGTTGEGKYYRVVVRPKEDFVTFRIHDVGRKGHSQRLSGRRRSGSWATQAWLINKNDAQIIDGKLVADDSSARKILSKLSTSPHHVKGDIFEARDRRNIPEREKPTRVQRKAQRENIKKAQRARWKY